MTVQTSTSRVSYTGSGTTGPFSIPFYFLANADIVAKKVLIADGTETSLVLTTDYTLTGAGDSDGGTLTLVATLSSSYRLVIYRDPAILQENRYPRNDPFPAETHEKTVDRLTMIAQRQSDRVGRTLRQPEGDATALSAIPSKDDRASKVLGFDDTGLVPTMYDPASAVTSAENVNFLQAGTGAVSRTAQAKMRESVSVLDFGADNTGATDASVDIAKALNSGAAVVTFPPGIYKVQSAIVGTNAALKRIEGYGATLRADITAVSNTYMLDTGTNNILVSIEGLTFDSLNPATTQTETWYGGTFSYDYRQYNAGLYVPDGSDIENCTFKQLSDALYIGGSALFPYGYPTKVKGCNFEKNLRTFTAYLCNMVEFSGNTAYLGSEITFPSCRNLTITNNTVFLPGTPAIDVGGSGAAQGEQVIISDNISYGRDGIVVEVGFDDITITGNQCYSTSDSPNGVGIGVTTNTDGQQINRLVISDNKISRYADPSGSSGQYAFGIRVIASIDLAITDVLIDSNQITNPGTGIAVEGYDASPRVNGVSIRNNTVREVRTNGIVVGFADRVHVSNNMLVSDTSVGASKGIYLNDIVRGRISKNVTISFVTNHYYFDGTQSDVVLDSPDHNAGTEALLWGFGAITGNLIANNVKMPASGRPTLGSWAQGSTVSFASPSANGTAGSVCTASGAPGTWCAFGPSYEEGTWTPTVASSAGAITTYSATGRYTKIGRVVTLSFNIIITNNGTGSGYIAVTGMPYAESGTYRECGQFVEYAAVGFTGGVSFGITNTLVLTKYDNSYPGGTGNRFAGTIVYQM